MNQNSRVKSEEIMDSITVAQRETIHLMDIVCYLFLGACFLPFMFPNPIIETNIQPYAALLGTLILIARGSFLKRVRSATHVVVVLGGTLVVALAVLVASGISMNSLRAIYNYYALLVIPSAVVVSLTVLNAFPERLFKALIALWFAVASFQFFLDRSFMTGLISGVRWSYEYRGVVGLASEPSFLGIACFYFLHICRRFSKNASLYMAAIVLMGSLYAQSAIGVLFLLGFFIGQLLDGINRRRLTGLAIALVVVGMSAYVLRAQLLGTRLYELFSEVTENGILRVLTDESANTRYTAITTSISEFLENYMLPGGFSERIGSGFGGILVELGVCAIPAMILISLWLARVFDSSLSRSVYTVIVAVLLFNNTQLGNPLLLLVIGINIWSRYQNETDASKVKAGVIR